MAERLAAFGYEIQKVADQSGRRPLRLPFLWIHGRRDYTISVMGANIYPEDLEQCLYALPELARITHSFCLSLSEGSEGKVRPCFNFEIEAEPSRDMEKAFRESILEKLIGLNADFRQAWTEYPETMVPDIRLYRCGEGPFVQDQSKIKQVRFLARPAQ
jgi:phenylacetate-CoA ligase